MALDRGGACVGVMYELPANDHKQQIFRLLEREVDAMPATNVPRWIWVTTNKGRYRALTFVAARSGPAYSGRQPLPAVAQVIARAAGHWGSSAAYLQRTLMHLNEHGIRDRNLWKLQHLVAEIILARAGTES